MNQKLQDAKNALDNTIKISRTHLYKPIQIAEILYRDRVVKDIDINDKKTYRTKSKKWRDEITNNLLGTKCTSSAKYQDDVFNAVTPKQLAVLSKENKKHKGVVEAYIYEQFTNKHSQLSAALDTCLNATKETFDIKEFIDMFWSEPRLKRSVDKVYEIVVFALFSTLIEALELKVEISINSKNLSLLNEFEDFAQYTTGLDSSNPKATQDAKVYRVGVTNAADRGLDMYSNWGPIIQVKHLPLTEGLAEDIVSSVSSDRVIIVCQKADDKLIASLLNQIGCESKIQNIITEANLCDWYERALRGKHSNVLGDKLINALIKELTEEFPLLDSGADCLKDRHYESIHNEEWGI